MHHLRQGELSKPFNHLVNKSNTSVRPQTYLGLVWFVQTALSSEWGINKGEIKGNWFPSHSKIAPSQSQQVPALLCLISNQAPPLHPRTWHHSCPHLDLWLLWQSPNWPPASSLVPPPDCSLVPSALWMTPLCGHCPVSDLSVAHQSTLCELAMGVLSTPSLTSHLCFPHRGLLAPAWAMASQGAWPCSLGSAALPGICPCTHAVVSPWASTALGLGVQHWVDGSGERQQSPGTRSALFFNKCHE